MILRTSAAGRFDEAFWSSRALNVDPAAARTGTHDLYSVALPRAHAHDDAFDRAAALLFRYDVFPPHRMTSLVCTPDRRIATGATVIQRIVTGPVVMEMGVRVVTVLDDVRDGARRAGFRYATLEGHVERGTATFVVREQPDQSIAFEIESWSKPGHWLAWLGRPVARLTQRTFTREALAHVRDRAAATRR